MSNVLFHSRVLRYKLLIWDTTNVSLHAWYNNHAISIKLKFPGWYKHTSLSQYTTTLPTSKWVGSDKPRETQTSTNPKLKVELWFHQNFTQKFFAKSVGFYKPLVVVESSCMITISASGQGKATSFHQFTVSWTFIILSCLLLEAIFILFCCFL